jgi:hypothetical protein
VIAGTVLELYTLPEHEDFNSRYVPPWGIDGRPARVGVRFRGVRGEVLLSIDGIHDTFWLDRAVKRLERGEFGGITEREAQRLRMDRAAGARIEHGRLFLAAYRYNPKLGDFARSHAPLTHHRGALLDDPWCVLCGVDGGFPRPPLYPCDMLRSVAEYHGLKVPPAIVSG